MILQSYVNCDIPGMRAVTYSGGGSGTVTLSGYLTLEGWLSALSTALQSAGADYTWSYDATTDRIVAAKNSGSNYGFELESTSLRDLLGFSSTTDWTTAAASFAGTGAPHGIVPLLGARQTTSRSGRQIIRRDYAPRRARHIAWGSGTIHGVRIQCTHAAAQRITAGPCVAGRVRIGEVAGASPMSSSARGGYIDGAIVETRRIRTQGPTEAIATMDYEIHHDTLTSTPSDWDPIWGSLARGSSVVAYARIEGIPHLFSERAIYTGNATHPESTTLVISDDDAVRYSIDREAGVTGASDLRIGILDPDNALGIFGKPSLVATLTANLDADDTTATVDTTTSWPSSGGFWVGSEYVEYSGKGATTFTGLSRGDWGPVSAFRAGAPLGWNLITDSPVQWQGRLVEIWVALVDCYGAPISTTQDDTYSRMIWSGTVRARPIYEGGSWVIDCDSLAQRLDREPGAELAASTQPYSDTLYDAWGPLVIFPSDAEIEYQLTDASSAVDSGRVAVTALDFWALEGGLTGYYCTPYRSLVAAMVDWSRARWVAAGLDPDNIRPLCMGVERVPEGGGAWRAVLQATATGVVPDDGEYRLGPMHTAAGPAPEWSREVVFRGDALQKEKPPGGGLAVWRMRADTGMDGRSAAGAVLRLPDDAEALLSGGTWPTGGGYLVVAGADGDEVASYAYGRTTGSRVYLGGLTRQIAGTPAADVSEAGVTVTAYAVASGSLGEQLVTVLESSGTGERGTYDTATVGYGLTADWVDEQSCLGVGGVLAFGAAVDPTQSLGEMYGGVLASQGLAICPVRRPLPEAGRLRWGVRSVDPFGPADLYLTDADLRADRIPQIPAQGLLPTPNLVRLEPISLGGIERAAAVIMLRESIVTDGVREVTYAIPWSTSALAATMMAQWGQQAIASRAASVCYEIHVTPEKDWLPGAVVDINITHPGLRDPADLSAGISGQGVIVETSRRLTGECTITVLVRRDALDAGPLCPSARVNDLDSSDITVTSVYRPDGKPLWEVSSDVIVYEAGVASSYTTVQISGISGNVITIGSVPGWLDSAAVARGHVWITYPATNATNATSLQQAHIHAGVSQQWL